MPKHLDVGAEVGQLVGHRADVDSTGQHLRQTQCHREGSEGDDQRRHPGLGDQHTVDGAPDHPAEHRGHQTRSGHPWTVAAHGGHHLRRNHRREHQHGSDGQIDTRCDDHERHADAENCPHGHVLGDQREVAGRKEAIARDDGEHQADDDEDAEDPEGLQAEDSFQQRVVAVVGPAAGGHHRALLACRAHAARPSSAPVIAPTNVSTLVSVPRYVATRLPRRSTWIRSQISSTCGIE